jgi:hypothetical protein
MKGCELFNLYLDKKWSEVRKYLSSDAAEEEKKSNIMHYVNGRTCLHRAVYVDAPDDIIKAMLDIGGKELVMTVDIYDSTALHWACGNAASYNLIKMLIEVGGKDLVMAKSKRGSTALHYLCRRIKRHTRPAKKIKLILQVGDANLLLSTKNHAGTHRSRSQMTWMHSVKSRSSSNFNPLHSSKRSKGENAANISSVALNTHQAIDDDDDLVNMLTSRHMATRSVKAQILVLKQEIDDLAI